MAGASQMRCGNGLIHCCRPKGPSPKEDGPEHPLASVWMAYSMSYARACQWKALPRCFGAASTVHDRFQEWRKAGVFEKLWQAGLAEYDEQLGLEWEWQAMDGAMTKAPLGG